MSGQSLARRLAARAFRRAVLTAYLSTLLAIVLMTIAGAVVLALADFDNELASAKAIAALGFISSAVTGLIGVIGSFLNGMPLHVETRHGDVTMTRTPEGEAPADIKGA